MKRIICVLALVTAYIPNISQAAAHTTADEYITDPADSGSSLFNALLMNA